jgi:uncharacterized protein (DUF58 family)
MRLTRRGYGAVTIAGLAILLSARFGPRALNAAAAPMLGAVLVGAVQVWRADHPTVEPGHPAPGFPGEERTWTLEIEGSGVVAVDHDWPDGLAGESPDAVVALPATVEMPVTLASRGVYDVSLSRVSRRDALGLVETTLDLEAATTAVVYPRVQRLTDRGVLGPLLADETAAERQAFDTLREYRPGDPLRHIHWKSSAKLEDFLVTEFEAGRRSETLLISAEATPGCADAMATAAATVALAALRAGLGVGLRLPGEELAPGSSDAHAATLLRALARADHGSLPPAEHADADVSVEARPRETLLRVGDGTMLFGAIAPESTGEVSAA